MYTRNGTKKSQGQGCSIFSLTHSPIPPDPSTPCFFLSRRFLTRRMGLYFDVFRLQIRGLVGTRSCYTFPYATDFLPYPRCARVADVQPGCSRCPLSSWYSAGVQGSQNDGTFTRTFRRIDSQS